MTTLADSYAWVDRLEHPIRSCVDPLDAAFFAFGVYAFLEKKRHIQ